MHTVIRNAWAGDPYKIDTLFMFMANMAWNSSMNTAETIDMLTDKAAVEIESPVGGIVKELCGEAGSMIAVGGPLIRIEVEGDGNTDTAPARSLIYTCRCRRLRPCASRRPHT